MAGRWKFFNTSSASLTKLVGPFGLVGIVPSGEPDLHLAKLERSSFKEQTENTRKWVQQYLNGEGEVGQHGWQPWAVARRDAVEDETATTGPPFRRGPPALGHPRGDLGRQPSVS